MSDAASFKEETLTDARVQLFGFRLGRNLGPSVTEERADVFLQRLFHILFGFFEIAPGNRDSHLDAGPLPAIIFGPECAFYRDRTYHSYGHSMSLHDYLHVSIRLQSEIHLVC